MLTKVRMSDPARVMQRYPHQLSGGMNQRVVIAMALASDPTLLILDEPTTGLDATVEGEVLDLVNGLRGEFGTSLLFISHNLGVIAKMCDRMGVLYAGRLVEEGRVREVFDNPRHPYTVGLLRCIPRGGVRKDQQRLDTIAGFLPGLGAELPGCVFADRCGLMKALGSQERCQQIEPPMHELGGGHGARCHFHEQAHTLPRVTEPVPAPPAARDKNGVPVLRAQNVRKTFHQEGQAVHALADIEFTLAPGETLGLVGESGSGKTTLARTLLGLTEADEGSVVELDGTPLASIIAKRKGEQVRAIQIVFQNPDSALNRRFSIHRIIARALTTLIGLSGEPRESRLRELAHSVRFDVRLIGARPAQLSGGLKQRVAIARAFAGDPQVVVCDEPTSALDVSVQAAILNLLVELQGDKGVAYLFISHDLGVVRYLSDRIAVLYLGRLMELGGAETVFPATAAPLHRSPALGGTHRRRRRATPNPPRGGDPQRRRASQRLCLSHPLPPVPGRDLRTAGAAAGRGGTRPLHALSHPRRRAQDDPADSAPTTIGARRRPARPGEPAPGERGKLTASVVAPALSATSTWTGTAASTSAISVGFPPADGRTTRRGAIVRADSLHKLTDAGWSALLGHGVRTVIDLRNDYERAADVAPRPAQLTTVELPLDGIEDREFWDPIVEGPQFGTPIYYRGHLERMPERSAAVLTAIARARPGGVVFHCVGGRDRTGQIAILVLALAVVGSEEIVADYGLIRRTPTALVED